MESPCSACLWSAAYKCLKLQVAVVPAWQVVLAEAIAHDIMVVGVSWIVAVRTSQEG